MAYPLINVRAKRREWALDQHELASLLGISQGTYSKVENGEKKPSVNLLIALQVVLGLSLRRLLPTRYQRIEDAVMAAGTKLDTKWAKATEPDADIKRRLLSAMAKRAKGNAATA